MSDVSFSTPILFLIFNRPEKTRMVLEQISRIRPEKLYIAADGPRDNNQNDVVSCRETRAVLDSISWNCEIITRFQPKNLGCRLAVSSAIDWFFSKEEEGIILEDDIMPSLSFFHFCKELLEKYRDNHEVMQICGFSFLEKVRPLKESYYFSKYGPIWGWASWRRAWQKYDVHMKSWPEVLKNGAYKSFCENDQEAEWRCDLFNRIYKKEIDTWDFQWVYAKLILGGLSIIPKWNLINNIGFCEDATHTKIFRKKYQNMFVYKKKIQFKHPSMVKRSLNFDEKYLNQFVFGEESLLIKYSRSFFSKLMEPKKYISRIKGLLRRIGKNKSK